MPKVTRLFTPSAECHNASCQGHDYHYGPYKRMEMLDQRWLQCFPRRPAKEATETRYASQGQ